MELIVYLEPSGEFKQAVEGFLNTCKQKYGFTTANKYGCHVTMTGFFQVDNTQASALVQQNLDTLFQNFSTLASPQVETKSLLVYDNNVKASKIPVHLLLPVSVPHQLCSIMTHLFDMCAPIVHLRIKTKPHISLAYWDEPEATSEQQQQWQDAVSHRRLLEQIQQDADLYFKDMEQPAYWDIVLYHRVEKGRLVGETHVFHELGRWRV